MGSAGGLSGGFVLKSFVDVARFAEHLVGVGALGQETGHERGEVVG
jgi:hypothetical protein